MRSEDWATVRALFEEALKVDASERDSWLQGRASEEILEHVRSLLAMDARSLPALDEPEGVLALGDWASGDISVESESPEPQSQSIGPFVVRSLLGQGRSGVVYRVWQSHPPRDVALKLMRASVWSESMAVRFETECRALARLSHPGIARVFEVGDLPEPGGVRRPYLVMELVEGGLPITDFAKSCSLKQRLELLNSLCSAIAHAHQRGVLHRDLKPGNVLVDSEGRVKVIDFGVARLSEDGPRATVTGQLLGTPAYMSPEQAAGGEADARTDVYAIGLIARELLGNPRKGDLAAVIAKATAHHPASRYASVWEFEGDLARFVAGHPVLARRPTLRYRLGMYLRRNRVVSAALALAFVGSMVGVIATIRSMGQVKRDNDEARATTTYLLDNVFVRLEDRIGSSEERRNLAQQLLPRVERLARESRDIGVRVSRARLLRILGDIEQEDGRLPEALARLRTAMQIQRTLVDASPGDATRRAELSIAIVRVGDVLGDMGDSAGQQDHYERAMALDRRLVEENPQDTHLRSNLAYSCERLAALALRRGEGEVALDYSREQVEIESRLLAENPDGPRFLREAFDARATRNAVLDSMGRDKETAQSTREELEIVERLARVEPESRGNAIRLLSALHCFALELAHGNDVSLAIQQFERALALAQTLSRADPSDRDAASWLVRIMVSQVEMFLHFGRASEALEISAAALKAVEEFESRGVRHTDVSDLRRSVHLARSMALRVSGQLDAADDSLRLSLACCRAAIERSSSGTLQLDLHSGLCALGAPTEAERKEAAAVIAELKSSIDARTLVALSKSLLSMGDAAGAIEAADRVLEVAGPRQTQFVAAARAAREAALVRVGVHPRSQAVGLEP